jgi:hypothetical protein
MNARLARTTGVAGLLYAGAAVANLVGTTDGPRPDAAAVKEVARIAAESTAIRWSAVLGVLSAIAFCAFTTGLALLISRSGRTTTGAALAVAGVMTSAIWIVSFASLAAAAQSAQTGARPDVTMALGALHSTTLLASFATAGAALLASVAAAAVRTRSTRAVTTLIGCAGLASALLVLDVHLDTGPFGVVVVLPFLGLPLWVAAMSVWLIVGRMILDSPTAGGVLTDTPVPRDGHPLTTEASP